MRANRLDNNQIDIVKALKKAGCSVQALNKIKDGCPDIMVSHRMLTNGIKMNWLFEIKDPKQPPSKRVLTEDEERWFGDWQGQVCIIETAEEALRIMGIIE